ncbi:MAG: UDP-N-acetylmuramate dehydrogenase [Candidatus Saccharibacteria bacterium]|nr:UDP-N-acetylmuramate dehydrogenase [Candidatus Saccharibacteria bacterium]
MRVNENILISSLTTMRLGGPARYVLEIEKPEEIPDAYGFAKTYNLPTFVLGGGANTIGHDEGFNGVIIINRMRGISAESTTIKAMGGELWDDVVEFATDRGLTGIEGLSKIPGLAGAAPVQNIGAYGQEIADTLTEIDVYDPATDKFLTLTKDDLNFSYRRSILNTTAKNRYFVISITLNLKSGQMTRPFYNSIERYIETHNITDFSPKSIRNIVSAIRADKLPDPLTIPSAGSFFKNIYLTEPEAEIARDKNYPVYESKEGYKINSGWFIEQAGLKGQLFHGFRVSDKAPLVLINESATSYNDLAKARDEIIAKVYDKFGYWLEQEPVELQ